MHNSNVINSRLFLLAGGGHLQQFESSHGRSQGLLANIGAWRMRAFHLGLLLFMCVIFGIQGAIITGAQDIFIQIGEHDAFVHAITHYSLKGLADEPVDI